MKKIVVFITFVLSATNAFGMEERNPLLAASRAASVEERYRSGCWQNVTNSFKDAWPQCWGQNFPNDAQYEHLNKISPLLGAAYLIDFGMLQNAIIDEAGKGIDKNGPPLTFNLPQLTDQNPTAPTPPVQCKLCAIGKHTVTDEHGLTPLHYAVNPDVRYYALSKLVVASHLLSYGIDPRIKARAGKFAGKTVADLVAMHTDSDCKFALLIKIEEAVEKLNKEAHINCSETND